MTSHRCNVGVGFPCIPSFHASRGGFIGVDIFFVISGYLITSIIVREKLESNFSLAAFYFRRVKRIFPSLIFVILASYGYAIFFLRDDQLAFFSKHVAWSSIFLTNINLYLEAGYFDGEVYSKPLLHLWSLAVEEQFYLIWPVALIFSFRFKKSYIYIAIIALASFLLNIFLVFKYPSAAFYLPITRFWELMFGALLVFIPSDCIQNTKLKNSLAFIGLALILIGFILINEESIFPGYLALLPALGAVSFILAGSCAIPNRVLGSKILVSIGLVSFPLYLWHWPLLSFARISYGKELELLTCSYLLVLSVVFAFISYYCIEKPIKKMNTKKAALFLILIYLGLGIASFIQWKKYEDHSLQELDGYISEIQPSQVTSNINSNEMGAPVDIGNQQTIDSSTLTTKNSGVDEGLANIGDIDNQTFFAYMKKTSFPCGPDSIAADALMVDGINRCFQSKKNGDLQIAIIGDSHAEHLFIGLSESLANKNIVYYIKAGIPSISDASFATIFKYVLGDASIKVVVLNSYWGDRISDKNNSYYVEDLSKTVKALLSSGKQIYITNDLPNFYFDPYGCKFKVGSNPVLCALNESSLSAERDRTNEILNEVLTINPQLKLIDTYSQFCWDKLCFMAKDGKLLFRDKNHLNIYGSRFIGEFLAKNINK
ncbi:acyltransferase [Polynucleobacter paneuropaeus]|nr:acyltransferase [Polynucleobacter paneuropaeus]